MNRGRKLAWDTFTSTPTPATPLWFDAGCTFLSSLLHPGVGYHLFQRPREPPASWVRGEPHKGAVRLRGFSRCRHRRLRTRSGAPCAGTSRHPGPSSRQALGGRHGSATPSVCVPVTGEESAGDPQRMFGQSPPLGKSSTIPVPLLRGLICQRGWAHGSRTVFQAEDSVTEDASFQGRSQRVTTSEEEPLQVLQETPPAAQGGHFCVSTKACASTARTSTQPAQSPPPQRGEREGGRMRERGLSGIEERERSD